jgi:hypothetical protein
VLQSAGFAEVSVEGRGGTRYAQALWPKADATAEIPPEVETIEEVPTAVIAGVRMTVKRKPKAPAKKRRKTSTTRRKSRG